MRLLHFATVKEAHPTLEQLKAAPHSPGVYSYPGGKIIISGIGVIGAAAALAPWLDDTSEVISLGLAASVDESVPLGTVVEIGRVKMYLPLFDRLDLPSQELAANSYPDVMFGEGQTLVSSLVPIHDEPFKEEAAAQGDFIDMEGYGVAVAATCRQVPLKMIKVVSDYAETREVSLMKQDISHHAAALTPFVS